MWVKSGLLQWLAAAGLLFGWAAPAAAMDISAWTCTGNCGTLGADGVVPLSPLAGTDSYGWVSTAGSVVTPDLVPASIAATAGAGASNGSKIQSPLFSATAGQTLSFYFNYVSTDGNTFADFAWARLLDAAGDEVAMLFAARTTASGDTVPGFKMPLPAATLVPASAPMIAGAPSWTPLGNNSGTCFGTGCGHTDWVSVSYNMATAGTYRVEFGVVNWLDISYNSGLAFDGAKIGGHIIGGGSGPRAASAQPVPALGELALALLALTMAGGAAARMRRKA